MDGLSSKIEAIHSFKERARSSLCGLEFAEFMGRYSRSSSVSSRSIVRVSLGEITFV